MQIRRFRKQDARNTSKCIIKTLKECNAKYYPKKIINYLIKEFQPEKIAKMALERDMLVIENNKIIIGTASLAKDGWICAFFIDPKYQGKGIGTKLLNALEKLAKKKKFRALRTHCAINSVDFYKKNGYRVVKQVVLKKAGRTYRIFKRIVY